ncbi:alanine--tRNA ligase-related protein [Streptomyces sp. IBSNAI002]|uniref:alanine--tRNA ligase-related protein n=1 Tax=Streptomyces sp. IBSNAI002 TaxID=3457500 RepID=UPI003FD694F8
MSSRDLPARHEARRTRTRLDGLAGRFVRHFAAAGLAPIVPEPAVPRSDDTVLFTNSAVVCFKPYLRDETPMPAPGVTVRQPCVRVQNLKEVFSDAFSSEHVLQFEMLGALSPPDDSTHLARATAEYFGGVLGLSREQVALKVAGDDLDLSGMWQRAWGGPILTDTEPRDYYRWGFGHPDLTGRGATFAIRQDDGHYRDLGNLIAFEHHHTVSGYGVGLGLETLAACLDQARWVLDCTPAGALIRPTSVEEAKLADLTGLLARAAGLGLRPSSRGRGHVLRRALAATAALADTLGTSRSQLDDWLRDLAQIEGSGLHAADWMSQHLGRHGDTGHHARSFDLSFWWDVPNDPRDLAGHAVACRLPRTQLVNAAVKDVWHGHGRQSVTLGVTLRGDPAEDKRALRALAHLLQQHGAELRGQLR